jgi:polysaccharide export outer membrane protein
MRTRIVCNRPAFALLSLAATVAVVGCHARPNPDTATGAIFRVATEQELRANEYRVAPPDKLRVRTTGAEERFATVEISPDGFITVPQLGKFNVSGKTTREIGELINGAVAPLRPDAKPLDVEVVVYASRVYHVFGDAPKTGPVPFTGRNTVVSAVAEAGFNDLDWPQTVYLFRRGSNRRNSATVAIDMTPVCSTGDSRSNYLLEEGDVLFVPPGPRIAWNQKLLRRILAW